MKASTNDLIKQLFNSPGKFWMMREGAGREEEEAKERRSTEERKGNSRAIRGRGKRRGKARRGHWRCERRPCCYESKR
jgi:hypothetical protein